MVKRRPPPAADALARLALDRFLSVRSGEAVTIEAWTHGLPWALPFVLEARRMGAEPTLVLEDEETFFRSLTGRSRRPPVQAPVGPVVSADVYVYFGGPEQFPRLFGLPAGELETVLARHGPAWWEAARRAGLRAARMAITTATETAAERYGVDVGAWRREILAASHVTPDRLRARGNRWARRLSRARTFRIRHPNGTDLTVGVRPRGMILEDGAVDREDRRRGRFWTQIPTGYLAIPIRPGEADGAWEANRPTYDRLADPPVALGARLEFTRGRLRQFAFDRGGEPFAAARAAGGPGSDRASAIVVGLNPGVDHAPELAEIARGSISLLLGNDRAVGGRNRARFEFLSTLAGATVEVDGLPWLVDGRERPSRPPSRDATDPRRRRPPYR